MSTRRHFLLNCTTLALTAAAAPGLGFAAPVPARETPLDQISLSAFKGCVQKRFAVATGSGEALGLVLVKAEELVLKRAQPHHRDAGNEKFRLLFRGPPDRPLSQNTYGFEHDRLGRFEMFITPVRRKDLSQHFYEAVFNRKPVNLSQVGSSVPV